MSNKFLNDIEIFKNSTLMSCIDDSINTKFESILTKHNTGGKMEECNNEVSEIVKQGVEAKIATFDEMYAVIDMKTHFNAIKSILQPTGQDSGIQDKIKEIYDSYEKYMNLNTYLNEGSNFYAKLTGFLGGQYQIVYDFC